MFCFYSLCILIYDFIGSLLEWLVSLTKVCKDCALPETLTCDKYKKKRWNFFPRLDFQA